MNKFSKSAGLALVSLLMFQGAALGQGVYGGYLGSEAEMNREIERAGQRALSEEALRSHHENGGSTAEAVGPDVTLTIIFPENQTGLDNVKWTILIPDGNDAHQCMALAQTKASNRLFSVFIPKKDVRRNHSYTVVVSDSMGDKFMVGRIQVGNAPQQNFTIRTALLTPASPRYGGTTPSYNPPPAPVPQRPTAALPSVSGYTPPKSSGDFKPPTVGPGFVMPGTAGSSSQP